MMSRWLRLLVCAMCGAGMGRAQTLTWLNSGADFGTAANWSGGVPGSGNTAQFASTPIVQPILTGGLTVGGVQFASGAGSYVLGGTGPLTLAGALGVDNQSSLAQTISVPLVFTAAMATINNQGTLTIGGAVTNSTTSGLALSGSGTGGTISGPIGGGSLIKNGAGTWTLSGASTYSGGTIINSGRLVVGASNALPSGTTLTLFNGGTLEIGAGRTQTIARFGGGPAPGGFSNSSSSILIGSGATLTIAPTAQTYFPAGGTYGGTITGAGALTIAGAAGTAVGLAGASTYGSTTTGTTVSGNATLLLGSSTTGASGSLITGPVGIGPLTLQSGATLGTMFSPNLTGGSDLTLANAVSLATNVTFGSAATGGSPNLVLSGMVTAGAASMTTHLAGNQSIVFTGTLDSAAANTALTFDNSVAAQPGLAALAGTVTSNLTSVTASGAAVVFASKNSLPTTLTVQAANNGYVGVAITPQVATAQQPAASDVLARIASKATFSGTFGFDSDEKNSTGPATFAENLDFSQFTNANFSIGSTSAAILTGAITMPAGQNYRFGNGGGALIVRSNLTAPVGVTVNSSTAFNDNALAVVFQGSNSYTGNLAITNSAGILDSFNALPPGRTVALGANAYLGATEAFTDAPSFTSLVNRVTSYTPSSILGLDSHLWIADRLAGNGNPWELRTVADAINLSGFGPVYLGTTTNLKLDGIIKAPATGVATKTLYLAAANEGHLTIGSPLISGNVDAVTIGMTNSPMNGSGKSAVALAAPNTYAGGTTLLSDTLLVSDTSRFNSSGTLVAGPLGTGLLTVPGTAVKSILAATDYRVWLSNPIALGGSLQLGRVQTGDGLSPDYNYLSLNGAISGAGSLTILGGAELNGPNTFTGGVFLNGGWVGLGSNSALGTGTLTVGPPSSYAGGFQTELYSHGPVTLGNNVVLNGALNVGTYGPLTLSGSVTLNTDSTIQNWNAPLIINGAVTGPGRLMFNGSGQFFLNGANTYSNGTTVVGGTLVFGSTAAIPANPVANALLATGTGYVGVASTSFPTSLQKDFLERFDKANTTGTIGFDSASPSAPNTFSGSVDLSGSPTGTAFNPAVRLGSSTAAILTGTIMPPTGSPYGFGGGGGFLKVTSNLVDQITPAALPRSVSVASTDAARPLTLVLSGTNTYTGGTSATHSAVIFGQSGALPASGSLNLGQGGYIGLQLAADVPSSDTTTVSSFLNRFAAPTGTGFVGFDSADRNTLRTIGADIGFYSGAPFNDGVSLATTTNLAVSGNLSFPGSAYRFAGYKGGQLTINSTLSGAKAVVVGGNSTIATAGDPGNPAAPLSTVTLNGNNSYTLGTTLYPGRLIVGGNNALGGASGGALTVMGGASANNFYPMPRVEAGAANVGIPNNVVLQTSLVVGGANNLTLSGDISGYGLIQKTDSGTLTLSGNNTFSDGVTLQQGSITFASDNAAGPGGLSFEGSGSLATFTSASPSIGSLWGDNLNDLISIVSAGANLTINQQWDSKYLGRITGPASVEVKAGSMPVAAASVQPAMNRLRFAGASTYSGGTKIGSGIVLIAGGPSVFNATTGLVTSGPLGTGPVTLNGGKLSVESGITLFNALTLTSGLLGGNGVFSPPTAPVIGGTLASPVVLAPGGGSQSGFGAVGNLTFASGLTLAPGGTYNWQVQWASPGAVSGWDLITVSGLLSITASAGQPFNLNLVSLGSDGIPGGAVVDFNPATAYSWPIVQATSISNFNAAAFVINDATFRSANFGFTGGQFFLTGSATALTLNFTPVPEPSTYALLAAGLAFLFIRRRRRQS